ncbi:MAG: hypothetical protein QOF40_931 [Actinomycetota bacterium]|nr:hypothetical protein [Actinomycetota bacterium]
METALRDEGLWIALVVGACGAGAAWALGRRYGWYAGYGCVAAAATFVGQRFDQRLGWELLVALLLVGTRSVILRSQTAPRIVGGLALLTGAALLADSLSDRVPERWKFVTFVAVLVLLPPMERVGDRAPRLIIVLLVVSVVGIYVCVPDTELVRPALGGFLGAALLLLDPELGGWSGGASVAGALMVWMAAAGGYGRPGSVVGGLACAGAVLFLSPVATGRRPPGWAALVVPILFTVFCARVAGFRHSWEAAALLVMLAVLVALPAQRVLCRAVVERHPRR